MTKQTNPAVIFYILVGRGKCKFNMPEEYAMEKTKAGAKGSTWVGEGSFD